MLTVPSLVITLLSPSFSHSAAAQGAPTAHSNNRLSNIPYPERLPKGTDKRRLLIKQHPKRHKQIQNYLFTQQ